MCLWEKKKLILKRLNTKQFDYFLSAGDVPVNDPSVSMESSQFSSEVLVTQVNMIYILNYFVFLYRAV